jgi:hypothetical protein
VTTIVDARGLNPIVFYPGGSSGLGRPAPRL